MINHPNQYQIEPTVHHPTGDFQNIKRLDSHRRSEPSSPFQTSTPRIQMSNRDDSPVIKFFNSKQVIPLNGMQVHNQQQQYQLKQQEDYTNPSPQQFYQHVPIQQVQPQMNSRNSLQKIQILKVVDQQQQQIGSQSAIKLSDGDNEYSLEGDVRNNQIKSSRQVAPLNLQKVENDENQPKTERQERNRSLPLQLASYMKPSLLLEKITNTFKNKSPNNQSLDRQSDQKGSLLSNISQQQFIDQQIQQSQGAQIVRQNNRIHPQIFPQKIRLLSTEMVNQEQINQQQFQQQQQQQFPSRQNRYSTTSQQNLTSNSTSPNSRIIARPDFVPSQQQQQYLMRPAAIPLNSSTDFNMSGQIPLQNISGSMTDRNTSMSSYQEIPRQVIYTPHHQHQPIFQNQQYPNRANSQRPSFQQNPTAYVRQSISHIGDQSGSDNRILNRSLNQFPPLSSAQPLPQNLNFVENQNRNFSIPLHKIQQTQPITQPYIIQQNAQAQQFIQQQYQQPPQQRQSQQMQPFQNQGQRQMEINQQIQSNENQRRIEQNLNRALNQRYSQQSQGDQLSQSGQLQQSQISTANKQSVNLSSTQQAKPLTTNTWNNVSSIQNSKNQNGGVNATQFSFVDRNDSKEGEESFQKDMSSIDTKDNELNQAIIAIQKITNEKYQLANQIEQLTNELSESTQSQIKYQQQISLLQAEVNQLQSEVQGQIHSLKMELENERMTRQNEAVIYNQRINEEQQKILLLQSKNDELQKTLTQRSQNIQKSVQELEQIGKILNDSEAWQKIYQFQKKSEPENSSDNNSLMDKIKQDSFLEDQMNKLLDERTILMQEITNQNDFLKGKLHEFKKSSYNSAQQTQKELSHVHILEQQLQISEIQKKELTQEQDIMVNLYECQIAQLKAQLQNKNDIIQAKYQENKFFLSQIQDLETSIKKSPYRKEDKSPIGHVAPFTQVPEKGLKQNLNSTNIYLETPEKQLGEQEMLNQSNEEEHLDQSEETSNVKQATLPLNSNSSAKMNQFMNPSALAQQQLSQTQEDFIKNKLQNDEPLSSSRNRRADGQPAKPVFITYQEYNMKMNKENRLKDQVKKQQQLQQMDNQQQFEILQDKFNQIEEIQNNKNYKNQYSPVKREDQIQLTSQPFQDTKNLNFEQEYFQEESSQMQKQSIQDQYVSDGNVSSTQEEKMRQNNNNSYGNNNKTIMDKYNDYLQGEKLYLEEDVITLGQQGNNHILSTIKEEQQSEHHTNVSSIQRTNDVQQQHPVKKNSIKNYSSYIENLKMNLKQSQEQRKQLEEQVNNIIKTTKIALQEDEEEFDNQLQYERDPTNNSKKNSGISLQIKYNQPSKDMLNQNEQETVGENEREMNQESNWDSRQMPELVDCDQYYDQNDMENNYNYQQNNKNNQFMSEEDQQYLQQVKQGGGNSKYIYTQNEPYMHPKQNMNINNEMNDYEREYEEILNQQNNIQQQVRYLN